MPANRSSTVGTCPFCGARIDRRNVLIEYDRAEETGIYAECPDCRDVVTPS